MTAVPAKEPLWSKDFVLAFVASFFVSLVFYLLLTTMALYAVEQFGASKAASGLASSMFVIGALVTRLFAGNVVDLFGRRRVLVISLGVYVLAAASYLPVDSVGALLAVRAVHGVAFGFASTAAVAIGQSLIPAARRAEGTGYFALSNTIGTAIGPSLAIYLVNGPGYDALFIAATVAGALATAAALCLRAVDARPAPELRARLRRFHPRDMLHPEVLPVASVILLGAVGYSGVAAFLNTYAEERGFERGASLFFVVYAAVLFAARLFVGRLQDRRGDDVVVYGAIAALVVGLALLGAARNDAMVVLAGGFCGLGFGTMMSALQAVAVGMVPFTRVGLAISTHLFMTDLGVGVGPVVLGALLGPLDLSEVYLALSGVVALSAVLYHHVHGAARRRRVAAREGARHAPSAEAAGEPARAEEPVAAGTPTA